MKIKFDFNSDKGLAFLQMLLKKVEKKNFNCYNYMALLKLAFFADRYHIRNYARPVSGSNYVAMKLGPVPSELKDIIDVQTFYNDKIAGVSPYDIQLKDFHIDEDHFSKSDIEAIDFAIDKFAYLGKYEPFAIANLTHAYPEWIIYKKSLEENPNQAFEMDYEQFLENAQPNHPEFQKLHFIDPFIPLTDNMKKEIIDEMRETTNLYIE